MEGEENSLDLFQTGNSNGAEILINGAANVGSTTQDGDHHLADIMTTGNNNRFSVSQSGLGGIVDYQNSILLKQEGSNNYAAQTQIGTGNYQNLAQLGNDNTADLLQNGNDNSLILEQRGDLNSATLTQIGNSVAPIEIYQTGGTTISVTHTAGGS